MGSPSLRFRATAAVTILLVALASLVLAPPVGHAEAADSASVELRGTFRVLLAVPAAVAGPGLPAEADTSRYTLEQADGPAVALDVGAVEPSTLPQSGQPVVVVGTWTDGGSLHVDTIAVDPGAEGAAGAAAEAGTSGEVLAAGAVHTTLVVLVDWTTPDAVTTAGARSLMDTQVAPWFSSASRGLTTFAPAAVTPWLAIAAPSGCDFSTIENEARQAATTNGFPASSYDHVIIYFPSLGACGWAGLGYLGGPTVWLNGYMHAGVIDHELGHNLGLNHANTFTCAGAQLVSSCTPNEYGDPYDTMGVGSWYGAPAYDAMWEDQLGWLPGGAQAVTATTTVVLNGYETGTFPVAAKVTPTVSSGDDDLWLEYRRAVGVDAGILSSATNGVLVHTRQHVSGFSSGQSVLLGLGPNGQAGGDYPLPAGQSWTSPQGITLSVTSLTATQATVAITYPATQPNLPTAVTATPGITSASLTWTAPSTVLNGAVTSYTVSAYANGALSPAIVTSTGSSATSATVSGLANGVTYRFAVQAVSAGGTSGRSALSNAIVPVSPPSAPAAPSVSAGEGQVLVGWAAPADNGSPIDHYVVTPYIGAVAQTPIVTVDAATALTVGSLVNGTGYSFAVAAHNALGDGAASPKSAVVTPGAYVPLAAPARLVDTRPGMATVDGQYAGGAMLSPGAPVPVTVAGRAGIPADAASVVLNVTVTGPVGPGHVIVYPCGQSVPLASNLNFVAGQTVPNAVVAGIGTSGRVCFSAAAATHLIVDVAGYFPTANAYVPLAAPARLVDTRPGESTADGQFAGGGMLTAGSPLQVTVAGRAAIPSDAASVMLNVTVTGPVGVGHLTVYPCGQSVPLASNLNFVAGQTVPNAVIAKIGSAGKVCFEAAAGTHLIVDAAGYFPTANAYVPLAAPARLVDTRPGESTADGQFAGGGMLTAGSPLQVTFAGRAGLPANAASVVLNVTVTGPVGAGHLTVYPCGQSVPLASNLNFVTGQTVPNAVIAKVGAAGKVCFQAAVGTHLVVDAAGALG